ncbi:MULTISPECIES: FAD-binding oxidoreductase [unclassified Roseateles]|uniref:NAD(P)/FAD-dependent oxidoreductase n=1 Tax=unclassified Roseateles TaxID=2626991 RepID=UPI0021011245|nr:MULTISPECIES: FAD-dependent oxidoreductase [unclassified Roseateles]
MSRRVAVVGAGLAGVATAYELAVLGCQVQVFERGGSVAEQASFAGSALLSPYPALVHAVMPTPWAWRWRRWRAGRRGGESASTLVALSQLGLSRTAELRHQLGLDDESTEGLLIALTDARRLAAAEARIDSWKAQGLQIELLDAEAARRLEPGLNADAPLSGTLALAHGGAGNARLFTQQLRLKAQRLGASFRFHTTVRAVSADGAGLMLRHEHTPPLEAPTRAQGAEREAGDTLPQPVGPMDERFDAVVLCNGLDASALLGQRLPLAAQHETSVTAPLRLLEAHPDLGPKAAWVDPALGLTITRTGQRVRVTGGLAVSRVRAKVATDFEALHRGLQHWFPGSVLHSQVQHGQSRRAVAADGLPVLGTSDRAGLWLSLSPGGNGWGLACGAASVLAQQIAGATPALDISALGPQRLT